MIQRRRLWRRQRRRRYLKKTFGSTGCSIQASTSAGGRPLCVRGTGLTVRGRGGGGRGQGTGLTYSRPLALAPAAAGLDDGTNAGAAACMPAWGACTGWERVCVCV